MQRNQQSAPASPIEASGFSANHKRIGDAWHVVVHCTACGSSFSGCARAHGTALRAALASLRLHAATYAVCAEGQAD